MGAQSSDRYQRCGSANAVDATTLAVSRLAPPKSSYDRVSFEVVVPAGTTCTVRLVQVEPGLIKNTDATVPFASVQQAPSAGDVALTAGTWFLEFGSWGAQRPGLIVTAYTGTGTILFSYSYGKSADV